MNATRLELLSRGGPHVQPDLASPDPLSPVRQALRAAAAAEAEEMVATAEAAAGSALDRARQQAAAVLAESESRGATAALILACARRAKARRQAHQVVLEARQAAFEELRERGRAAAAALADEPDYPELVAGLVRAARDALGPSARVAVDGPHGAGVTAEADRRRIDLRLSVLADRALATLGPRLQELWR